MTDEQTGLIGREFRHFKGNRYRLEGLIKSPRPRFDLAALQANSHDIGARIHDARRNQLDRVGPDDPDSPVRVLAELDILNSYERIRSCYINMAETLAGRK